MTLAELRQDTRYLTNTSSTSYPDTDLDFNLNRRYEEVAGEIVKACDSWDWGGKIATADVVANQQGYSFPTGILTIKRIDVTMDGGSTWQKLRIQDVSMFNASATNMDSNQPVDEPFAELHDNGIFIYPTPTVNATGGLKIWYQKEPTNLTNSGDEPNLIKPIQRALSIGAAADFLIKQKQHPDGENMEVRFYRLIEKVKEFYAFRVIDNEDRIVSAEEYFGEEYGEDI